MHKSTGSWGAVVLAINSLWKRLCPFLHAPRGRATEFAPEFPFPGSLSRRLAGTVVGVALAAISSVALAVPTVDGLIFAEDSHTGGDGDPDIDEYILYDTSAYGSNLYIFLNSLTNTLYVALVVDRDVNDNVFGRGGNFKQINKPYANSAGWDSIRTAGNLVNSEFAEFTFECAKGSTTNSYAWQQGYACEVDGSGTPTEGTGVWESDEDQACAGGSGADTAPDGLDSASSFMYNMNRYNYTTNAADYPWDLFVDGGSGVDDFHSPFADPPGRDTVDFDDSYPAEPSAKQPGYSALMDYEWSMIYEWSVDLGESGAQCGNNNIFVVSGSSHHSPSKIEGVTDDPFDTPPTEPLSDFGDAPDSYKTSLANDGARHEYTANGPLIGSIVDVEPDAVIDDQNPAEGDDNSGAEDEKGVHLPQAQAWTAGDTYSVTVDVTNTTGSSALVCGWIDFNDDGDFDDVDTGAGQTNAERECVTVATGTDDGTATLHFIIPEDFNNTGGDDGLYFSRFRITTDWTSSTDASPHGTSSDGEVEDHTITTANLPVRLNAFSSEFGAGGLKVSWQTASETNNVGFELLGKIDDEWQTLSEFIPSQGMNAKVPQTYEESIPLPGDVTELSLVDYDTRGWPERFGPFTPGESYGEVQPVEEIDWDEPRSNRQQRLQARGFVKTGKGAERGKQKGHKIRNQARWRKLKQSGSGRGKGSNAHRRESEAVSVSVDSAAEDPNSAERETITLHSGALTHVAVTEPGIQRVSYEALRGAGLDLAGVRHGDIAVTSKGEPVARWIDGQGHRFGPGDSIEFIGQPPEGDDALYIESNLYQVSIDEARAREADQVGRGRARNVSGSYQRESVVDRPLMYHSQSPTGDPWVERTVLTRGGWGPSSITLDVPVEGPILEESAGLIVGLGTITDLPDITRAGGDVVPEHNVTVELKGPDATSDFTEITTASISGQQDWEIEAELPAGLLDKAGIYKLRLTFETDYRFSLVVVDRYGVRYAAPYEGPRLDFAPDPEADGYRVTNVNSAAISAYAAGVDGSLTRIDPGLERTGDGYAVELRQIEAARIWVDEDPHKPEIFTTEAPGDLLAEPGDLVVVTDSSFVGADALEDYVRNKTGFNTVVVDVEDIYNGVGYGMALPGAINDYLKARNEIHPLTHVQLVGADCYDRLNYISDCISFIPLPTAPVGLTKFSPSQNRLVDLDGDGVGDKPVGQFSVRDEAELATIVDKGASWRSNVAGSQSALLVADDSDGTNDFLRQIERLNGQLDWATTDVLSLADHPDISTARDAFKNSLDAGRAITMFSGHSSATIWSMRSLLTPGSAKTLSNAGRPTMMVPLACETTFDISPNANVLGHQLMYAGDQGAVAISGAVSLSGLQDNERMANQIIDGLKSGLTLGEAVQSGRDSLGVAFKTLHDNWITQGDVTAKLAP